MHTDKGHQQLETERWTHSYNCIDRFIDIIIALEISGTYSFVKKKKNSSKHARNKIKRQESEHIVLHFHIQKPDFHDNR